MKGSGASSRHDKIIILQQPCMRRANGAVHTYAFSNLEQDGLVAESIQAYHVVAFSARPVSGLLRVDSRQKHRWKRSDDLGYSSESQTHLNVHAGHDASDILFP